MRIITLHECDEARLDAVTSEMQTLGSPTIRVVNCGDHYQAIEGTHRLISAARLGIPVNLDEISADEPVDADSLDWGSWDRDDQPTGDYVASEAYRHGWRTAWMLEMDSDGRVELLQP